MITPHTQIWLRKSYDRVTQTHTNTPTLRTATTSLLLVQENIDHMVDRYLHLWHLENSSPEYTRVMLRRLISCRIIIIINTTNIHVIESTDILEHTLSTTSKMDRRAKSKYTSVQ